MPNENILKDVSVPFKHFVDAAPIAPKTGAREVPVKEAKAKLTELLRAAEAGERIVLTRHGKPVADLVPHDLASGDQQLSLMDKVRAWRKANPRQNIGWVSPDFDDQLPEDFLLQPLPDDCDEVMAEHNRRAREARLG